MEINLNVVIKDSDGDGLTDIEERKMLTNPLDEDSDDDGIIDGLDKNPLHKSTLDKYNTLTTALLPSTISYDSIVPFDINKCKLCDYDWLDSSFFS